jgi:hypothetical protein
MSNKPTTPAAQYTNPALADMDHQTDENWLSGHIFACSNEPVPQDLLEDRKKISAELLQLALRYVDQEKVGLVNGLDRFVLGFKDHLFLIQPCIYVLFPKLSRITLLRWKKDDAINPWPPKEPSKSKTHTTPTKSDKPKNNNRDTLTIALNSLIAAKSYLNNNKTDYALIAIEQAEHHLLFLKNQT